MASTFCQKLFTIFCQKAQYLYCLDHMILFKFHQHEVQILIKYCMDRLWTFNVSINNGNIKCLIGKIIFPINLPLKLFCGNAANADIGSLKSLHTFLNKCLYIMLVKFEQNHMVQTSRNF